MDDPAAEKIARNNAVFRNANEQIESAAAGHGLDDGRIVPFICECSDERCTQVIRLTLEEYRHVRSNRRWFAHAPGHEETVPGAVRPLEVKEGFVLVEKIGRAGDLAAELASNEEAH